MNLTHQTEHLHSHRYTRTFNLDWLKDHPNFVGFMDDTVDGDFTAESLRFEYPWKDSVNAFLDADGRKFAPYMGYLFNAIVDNEPGRSLRLYCGFNPASAASPQSDTHQD